MTYISEGANFLLKNSLYKIVRKLVVYKLHYASGKAESSIPLNIVFRYAILFM